VFKVNLHNECPFWYAASIIPEKADVAVALRACSGPTSQAREHDVPPQRMRSMRRML
jgi:hypothetical protein